MDELPEELHPGHAKVTDDCAAYHLPPTALGEFMDTCDGRRYIYQMMSEHLHLHKARFYQLTSLSAGEHLDHFNYDIVRRYGFSGCVLRDYRLPMLRCNIANYTGVTREILEMVAERAFRFTGRNISALRPDIMKQLAGE